jgi:TrmH family RNA methyltransferase
MENLPPLSLSKQKAIRKLKQKKYRNSAHAFICEGFRMFAAALKSAETIILEILVSTALAHNKQTVFVLEEARKRNIPISATSEKIMQTLSEEVSPPGLIFTVKKSIRTRQDLATTGATVLLYLDRITDPGNIGTLIRSTAWFGIPHVILSPDCVDPFNPKSVRASAGAIFVTRIYPAIEFDWVYSHFKKKNYAFIATVAGNGISPDKWQMKGNSLIFFGQEAGGLSAQILEAADVLLNIPGVGKIESLNLSVAAGITLYEVFNKQMKNKR